MTNAIQPFNLLVITLAGWLNRPQLAECWITTIGKQLESPRLLASRVHYVAIFYTSKSERSRGHAGRTGLGNFCI